MTVLKLGEYIINHSGTKDINSKNNSIDIISGFLILSFFTSQFYFWSSGIPQFSHIFIILSLLLFLYKNNKVNPSGSKVIFLFIIYTVLVNLAWLMLSNFETSYIMSIFYWIFNFFLFLLLLNLKVEQIDPFLKILLKCIFLSYVLEVILWSLGFGGYSFSPRYNGFFNDPNQMAFWVLSTSSIYLYLSKKKINNITIYFLALFLIVLTLSRSAMLGFVLLTLGLIFNQKGSVLRKILLSLVSLIIAVIIVVILNSYGVFDDVIARILLGLSEKDEQAEGRGFDIVFNHPEYLVLGAGQGNYSLYSPTGNEIHSTWLGIFFYYGIFGLSLFLIFLYAIFRKLSFAEKIIFLSPMFYGFTTYSARTTIFWFFVAVFVIARKGMINK